VLSPKVAHHGAAGDRCTAGSANVGSGRKLCEEVKLHLGYRWFCRLELDDKVPDHSMFSVNRHRRIRDSDIFRQVFEAVVRACQTRSFGDVGSMCGLPESGHGWEIHEYTP